MSGIKDEKENKESILNRIRKQYGDLSRGQKRLADYVLANYEKAAFMTASELGMEAGVSESTAVRFASAAGCSGYPQFQEELADLIKERLHSVERIEITGGSMTKDMIIENVLNSDAERIKMTLDNIDVNAFKSAVDSIINAGHIYVVGVRSCALLASFLTFYLRVIFDGVTCIASSNVSEIFEQMLRVCEDDVVIGISFPRYSVRTLKAMEFANNRNAKVISITDSIHSPMNMYSSCNLLASSDMASAVDSLVAPLSLINALIVALFCEKKDEAVRNLELLENIWNDYSYDGNDEINLLNEDIMSRLRKMDE